MDKNIPLSQLIRLGAKQTAQCRHRYFEKETNSACALGAAYIGKFVEFPNKVLLGTSIRELIAPNTPEHIITQIVNLNDDKELSREQIADWLEQRGY